MKKDTNHREEVATFAMYSIGSALDDDHPAVERERELIMRDARAYWVWSQRFHRYQRWKDEKPAGALGVILDGTPLSWNVKTDEPR